MTTGASLQGLNDDKVFGHDNFFTIGASVDRSKIGFQGNSELGYIYPDFFVGPNARCRAQGRSSRPAAISASLPSASRDGTPITAPTSMKRSTSPTGCR